MNVFEKIIEKLEEMKIRYFLTVANTGDERLDIIYESVGNAIDKSIEVVNQVAEGHRNGWKTVVNEEIKNPFANISTVGCVNCEHKDEYIIELEEHNNGWIPLSSGKRPKDNQFILFTVKLERGGNLETFYNTKYGFYDELRDAFVISDGSVEHMPFGEVTTWQPLPEPYKPEGE